MSTKTNLISFDAWFIDFCRKFYQPIARVSLFIIFFVFGFLKLAGLSPANSLAIGFAEKMGLGSYAYESYIALAIIECFIGILILVPKFTRATIFSMLVHMLLVSAPLVLYTEAVWSSLLVPNLEGQYILKNIALVALALGLVANTTPFNERINR